jgi:rhodanese-related sulfurtransferase
MFPEIPTMSSTELAERWRKRSRHRDAMTHHHDHREAEEDHLRDDDGDDDDDDETTRNNHTNDDDDSIILIDVRTEAERRVSMIPGAIDVREFERREKAHRGRQRRVRRRRPFVGWSAEGGVGGGRDGEDATTTASQPLPQAAPPTSPSLPFSSSVDPVIIVTYCTVGYRSGREARRIQDAHPHYRGRIYNLDGILAYTYVRDAPPLVVTTTATTTATTIPTSTTSTSSVPARKIHTYGPAWGDLANPDDGGYEAVWFEPSGPLVGHLIRTAFVSVGRAIQHAFLSLLLSLDCRFGRSCRDGGYGPQNHQTSPPRAVVVAPAATSTAEQWYLATPDRPTP